MSDIQFAFTSPGTYSFLHGTGLKIFSFLNFPEGWHFGQGKPPAVRTVLMALRLHSFLLRRGFIKTDSFPGISGELAVTAYDADNYFEFTVEPDETITCSLECGDEILQHREGLTQSQAIELIQSLEPSCNTSEFYQRIITTLSENVSIAWPSAPTTKALFRWYKETASCVPSPRFAGTSGPIMEPSLQSPRSIGSFPNRFSRVAFA